MNIYFDFEMTGLHPTTTPISLGLIAEDGRMMYLEFDDYNDNDVDDWVQEHVVDELWQDKQDIPPEFQIAIDKGRLTYLVVGRDEASLYIDEWLRTYEETCYFYGDCLAYDWLLMCGLYGESAFSIPEKFYYIPFDLCTSLLENSEDPDVSREEFAGVSQTEASKHNALFDAIVIKECYKRLENGKKKVDM